MSKHIIEKFICKVNWNLKKRKLNLCGRNSHVGYCCILKNPENITIGDNFSSGNYLKMEVWTKYREEYLNCTAEIVIGDNVSIMDGCQISAADGVYIGDGVLLGNNVFITDNFHGSGNNSELSIPPIERGLYIKGKVKIGKNVWVGRNVCIMPNVSIGDGAIIGANAVVTKNVPSGCIVAGVPARIIRNMK